MSTYKSRFIAISVALSFPIATLSPFVSQAAGPVSTSPTSIKSLQRNILALQKDVDRELYKKAHMILREQNFELSGKVNGKMEGSFTQQSRFSSMLAGGVLGALALAVPYATVGAIPTLASTLSAPLALGDLAAVAAVGGGVGAAGGSLMPETTGRGTVTGSLEGKIEGKGWDNNHIAKTFVAFVVDPSHANMLEPLANQGFESAACASEYTHFIKGIMQSRRFFTNSEMQTLLGKVTKIQDALTELADASVEENSTNQIAIQGFISASDQWLERKLTVMSFGSGLMIEPQVNQVLKFRVSQSNRYKHIAPQDFVVPGDANPSQALEIVKAKMQEMAPVLYYQLPQGGLERMNPTLLKVDSTARELFFIDYKGWDNHEVRIPVTAVEGQAKTSQRLVDATGAVCSNLKDLLARTTTGIDLPLKGLDANSEEVQMFLANPPLKHKPVNYSVQ